MLKAHFVVAIVYVSIEMHIDTHTQHQIHSLKRTRDIQSRIYLIFYWPNLDTSISPIKIES